MKRAQISGQVLIFVLALFITAAVLLFGYRSIKNIKEQQEKIELIKFKNDFEEAIETAAYSYGSSKSMSLIMPRSYDELCLIDRDLEPSDSKLCDKNNIICEVWEDPNSRDNAFLLKKGSLTPESFYAGKLSVGGDEGFLCINTTIGSTINFIVEGIGRKALVRK